ncbi:MAG TPA: hypothetical protein VKS43_15170 [Burkholderiales bacterium]|nr:hypothetical protein [Burkholderiales bacterium]
MLHFSDLQRQPLHVQLLSFAGAYLDSAETLCLNLCRKARSSNYAHGAVVMSLTFHSLELFFKAGIVKVLPKERFAGKAGHDLDALSKRFFKLYPKKEFQFEVPFRDEPAVVVGGLSSDELATLRSHAKDYKRRVPEDQRHRYPTDGYGKSWQGAFGFEPNSFVPELIELQRVYARVRPLLCAS